MAAGAGDSGNEGNARQFRELALPYLDDIFTLARYLTSSAADAEDAAQECFLRAFRHFDSYRGPAIKPWLLAILRNACRATYVKNAGVIYMDTGGSDLDAATPPIWTEAADTPERLILRQHDTDTMRRLIGNLSPEFREVIVLREINDLSYRDIATVIEVPIGTVMSRLARGRALLREAWIAAEGDIR
jgi:RNA polymerase sigma-70 factor (ECF subfamily)